MYSIRKIRLFIPKKPNSCVPVKCPYPAEVQSYHESHTGMYSEPAGSYYIFDAPEFRDKPSAKTWSLAIRDNAIIRSGMKSILNFRHKIEKYGFICVEFGNAHPCLNFPSRCPHAKTLHQYPGRFN